MRKTCGCWRIICGSNERKRKTLWFKVARTTPQWWRDRLEWIEESADKLQLSLDPTDTSWTEDAIVYHQLLIDERQEIRKRLLGNPIPLTSPENIFQNEKFFDEYWWTNLRC